MATAEEAPAGVDPAGGVADGLGNGSSRHRGDAGEALNASRLPAIETGATDSDGLCGDPAALPSGAGVLGAIGQGRANFENQFQPVPQVTHNANADDSLAAVGNRPQSAENGGLLGGEGATETPPASPAPAPAVGENFHTILGASPDGVGVPVVPGGGGAGGALGAGGLGDDAGQLPPADCAGVASAAGLGGDIFKMSPPQADVTGPVLSDSDAPDLDSEDQAELAEDSQRSLVTFPSKVLPSRDLSLVTKSPNVTDRSLVTFQADVTGPVLSDSDAPDLDSEDQAGDNWMPEYVLDQKKLFEVTSCGCTLPKWKGVEWRAQENGHRCLWYVGLGVSATGKTTKRRRYGRYYTHRAIKLFVEGEYANELNTFEQRQSFGKPKRRAKA